MTKAKTSSVFDSRTVEDNLPDVPSELLLLALDDLARAERSRRFQIDMGQWVVPVQAKQKKCTVCFAGSVMAGTLGAPTKANRYAKGGDSFYDIELGIDPTQYQPSIEAKLNALNEFRMYNVSWGLETLYDNDVIGEKPDGIDWTFGLVVTDYEDDKKAWRKNMVTIASRLAAFGL